MRCAMRARAASRSRSSCRRRTRTPSCETSSPVTLARMSRARGPQRPIVVQAVVTSTSVAEPSSGRRSRKSLRSAIPCAPPVTMRNSSSPSRMIVRSDLNPPPATEHGRVDDPADGHVHLREHRSLQRVERARALDVEDRERGEVEEPGVLAHREMLGVDDRRPPARVPLGLARARPRSARRAARSPRTTAAAPSPRPRRRPRRAPPRARASARSAGCGRSPTARPGG